MMPEKIATPGGRIARGQLWIQKVRAIRGLHAIRRLRNDTGSATAEYAVATMGAVGFAGLLLALLKSDLVKKLLTDIITSALHLGS